MRADSADSAARFGQRAEPAGHRRGGETRPDSERCRILLFRGTGPRHSRAILPSLREKCVLFPGHGVCLTARMQSIFPQLKEPIAIIGIGCRFPGGADSPAKLWKLLESGVDAITPVPAGRWDAALHDGVIPDHGGFVSDVDRFDAAFFGVAPKEAESLDPQQRLLLEVSWEALEHAGIDPETLRDSDTGVFVGIFTNDYQLLQVEQRENPHLYDSTGASAATASGRIAYFFGWHGPAVSVNTASSSSLVAFHQAVTSLQSGECQMALAAGVNLILTPNLSAAFARAGMLSPDGRSKGFDAAANGYVRGEGCGVVVLKRLSDALHDGDNVLALVRGTAINQDGASRGLTMPDGDAQQAVIRKALTAAGLQPRDISYIEAHGSGTPVGDPVEGNALQAVYGTGRAEPWVVGSIKTNIGHLEAAAGIAGVIKVVLSMGRQTIPAHLHFRQLNPALSGLQATIPVRPMAWKNAGTPRRAGVSSFGFSGTNAHVILEEAPPNLRFTRLALRKTRFAVADGEKDGGGKARGCQLFVASAKDPEGLRTLVIRYVEYLHSHPAASLSDVCYTAATGRSHMAHRVAAVASTTAELREQLRAFLDGEETPGLYAGKPFAGPQKTAFLFTGGGAQYAGMGRELYETQPLFRQILDECDELFRAEFGLSLLEVLYSDSDGASSRIDELPFMQPALFAIGYALAKLWETWGVRPDVVMGHSAGEYAAACLAGVFSFADGLRLTATRGRLMSTTAEGAVFVLETNDETARAATEPFAGQASLSIVNGPQNVVVSGGIQAVEEVLKRLPGVKATRLKILCAAHSPLMDPILDEFETAVRGVSLENPKISFVSSVTGGAERDLLAESGYWRRHLRDTVRFADGVRAVRQLGCSLFLEIGPKPTLLNLAQDVFSDAFSGMISASGALMLPSLRAGQSDWLQMLSSLGEWYASGGSVDWKSFWEEESNWRQRLDLPTYPFQRQRYWVATQSSGAHFESGEGRGIPLSSGRQRLDLANDPAFRLSFEIGQEQPPYYRHHRVFGRALFSTGSFLELMLSTGRDMLSTEQVRLENVVFERAVVFPAAVSDTLTLQIVLTPKGTAPVEAGVYTFDASRTGKSTWLRHVSASLQAVNLASEEMHQDWAALKRACPTPVAPGEYYAETAARQVAYRLEEQGQPDTPDFQVLRELWRGDGTAYGRVQVASALAGEAEAYSPHAMLLEGAVQVARAAFPDAPHTAAYLPVSVDQVTLYRSAGANLWAYATRRTACENPELVSVDVSLVDHQGVIARLSALTFKQTTADALLRPRETAGQETAESPKSKLSERLAQAAPEQRPLLLGAFLQQQAKQVLGLRTGKTLPEDVPLKSLGMDSLMTNDLRARLQRELQFGIAVDQIMRSDLTISGLSDLLAGRLDFKDRSGPAPAAESDGGPETEADMAGLVPQLLGIVTKQEARQVMIDGRWRCDFASCNYLGLDLHPDVMASIAPAVAAWGVHPSWTRLVASPAIYDDLERELAAFLGAEETLVFPSLSLLHLGVIPLLTGSQGVILKDIQAHNSLIEACERARANGTEVIDFRHNDPASLEERLAACSGARTKLIVIDGVYSMSGSYPPLPDFVRVAKRHGARIYLDDAHGIGVIGARPTPEMPYGYGGNGIVNYYGLRYQDSPIIYTAGLSKSFSSYGAFITCADKAEKQRLTGATTFIFSGPSPVASLASALAGLRVNAREGDAMRAQVYRLTRRLVDEARALGFAVQSDHYFPIVSVPIGKTPLVIEACRLLWEHDTLITPAVYPVVARDRGVLRFSITAANTDAEIDRALEGLAAVRRLVEEPEPESAIAGVGQR